MPVALCAGIYFFMENELRIIRTDASHKDFISLVKLLDAELAVTDGDEHAFYHQYNHITHIKHALVAHVSDELAGIGAIKKFDDDSMEVKRMYVLEPMRGKGLAVKILQALEAWAVELGAKYTILETGKRQPSAIALYEKCGYQRIENYGQYAGMDNSVCFRKELQEFSYSR